MRGWMTGWMDGCLVFVYIVTSECHDHIDDNIQWIIFTPLNHLFTFDSPNVYEAGERRSFIRRLKYSEAIEFAVM